MEEHLIGTQAMSKYGMKEIFLIVGIGDLSVVTKGLTVGTGCMTLGIEELTKSIDGLTEGM